MNGRKAWKPLIALLLDHFGDEITELFEEEPPRLDQIQEAEQEMFDRIWYYRSLQREYRLEDAADSAGIDNLRSSGGPGREKVQATYPESGQLGPYTDFELGMLHGKLSTLRWVLASNWDFLGT